MRAFVTGSRVYGVPNPKSDLDLVVLVSHQDLKLLQEVAEDDNKGLPESQTGPEDASLRFGRLNLIVVTNEASFAAWKLGTHHMIEKRHGKEKMRFDKKTAAKLFDHLRELLKG